MCSSKPPKAPPPPPPPPPPPAPPPPAPIIDTGRPKRSDNEGTGSKKRKKTGTAALRIDRLKQQQGAPVAGSGLAIPV